MTTLTSQNKKAAESAAKDSVEHGRQASALSLYAQQLEALKKSRDPNAADQYRNVIKRLSEEYKTLGTETDLLATKHQELYDLLKRSAFEAVHKQITSAIDSLKKYNAELDNISETQRRFIASNAFYQAFQSALNLRDGAAQELEASDASIAVRKRQQADAQKHLIDALLNEVVAKNLTIQQAKEYLQLAVSQKVVSQEFADQGVAKITSALEQLNKVGETTVESLNTLKTMSPALKNIFDSLGAKDKAEFIEKYRQLITKVAADAKALKDAGMGDKTEEIKRQREEEFAATFRTNQEVKKLQGSFKSLYDSLDTRKQLEFIQMWEEFNGRIENVKKSLTAIGRKGDIGKALEAETEDFKRQLETRFGIQGFTQDLLKLYNTLDNVEDRLTFLDKLVSHEGEKKRVTELFGRFEETRGIEKTSAAVAELDKRFKEMMQVEFGMIDLRKEFGEFYNTLTDIEKVEFAREFIQFNKTLEDTKRLLSKTGMNDEDVKAAAENLQSTFLKRKRWVLEDRALVKEVGAEIDRLYSEDRKLALLEELKGLESELSSARDIMEQFNIRGEEAEKILERIRQKFVVLKTGDAFAAMREGAKDFGAELDTNSQTWYNSTKSALGAVQDGFKETFAGVARGELNVFASFFKRFADSLVDIWADAMAKMTMKALMDSNIGQLLSGLGQSISYAIGATKIGPEASYGTYGRASGGPVIAGRAYVVGEKRPEIFVPEENGRIIPSIEQFMKASASGRNTQPVQVSVHNYSNAPATVKETSSPGGQRKFEIMIGNALSSGPAVQALTRMGLRPSFAR